MASTNSSSAPAVPADALKLIPLAPPPLELWFNGMRFSSIPIYDWHFISFKVPMLVLLSLPLGLLVSFEYSLFLIFILTLRSINNKSLDLTLFERKFLGCWSSLHCTPLRLSTRLYQTVMNYIYSWNTVVHPLLRRTFSWSHHGIAPLERLCTLSAYWLRIAYLYVMLRDQSTCYADNYERSGAAGSCGGSVG